MSGFAKVLTCGHCNRDTHILMTEAPMGARATYQDDQGHSRTANAIPATAPGVWPKRVAYGGCTLCGQVNVIVYRTSSPAPYGDIPPPLTDMDQYPPSIRAGSPAAWPETLRVAWDDVTKVQAAGASPATVTVALGTCLQLACRLLEAKKGQLVQEIDDLKSRNIITGDLAAWAHRLRALRNSGTHDFDVANADADEAVEFLKLFLHLTFTLRLDVAEKSKRTSRTTTG